MSEPTQCHCGQEAVFLPSNSFARIPMCTECKYCAHETCPCSLPPDYLPPGANPEPPSGPAPWEMTLKRRLCRHRKQVDVRGLHAMRCVRCGLMFRVQA